MPVSFALVAAVVGLAWSIDRSYWFDDTVAARVIRRSVNTEVLVFSE